MANLKNSRICLVTLSLAGGGAERSCALLSRMLHHQGYQVHIATLNDQVAYPYSGTLFNIGRLKTGKDPVWKRFFRLRKLRKYLREQRIDVVIDHRPKNDYYRELFYHRYIYFGVKRIYVTHSAGKRLYLTERPEAFARICNSNAANVGVSRYICDELLEAQGIRRNLTIHNPYDPSWALQSAQLPDLIAGSPFILTYGRLVDEVKDYRFLMQAFDRSLLWQEGIRLVIMGEGPDRDVLVDFGKRLDAAGHIVFLPHNKQPFGLVKAAHCVALTSRFEGFPMVLLESLSLGTPVVSLDMVSGPSELVRHRENGLLIQKRDIAIFAKGLSEMFDDRELYQKCREHARKSVHAFSMNQIASRWHKLLQDV